MILILADDLTGAADSGAQFARRGFPTLLSLEPGSQPGAEALVLAMETRALAKDEAAAWAVRSALELLGEQTPLAGLGLVYKKIDSTLRGHPAAELAALMMALGETRALIAPAFPAQGRTALGGIVLVGGQSLKQTAFASQAPSGDLLEVFSVLRPALLPLAGVRGGESAVRAAIRSANGPLVADAEDDSDLQALARAGLAEGLRVFCGSAGLAAALAAVQAPPSHPSPAMDGELFSPPSPVGKGGRESGPPRLLAVAGSLHPTTMAQVRFARQWAVPVIRPPSEFFNSPKETGLEATAQALMAALEAGGMAVLATTPGGSLSPGAIAGKLARAAALAFAHQSPTGLFFTGGETARAACAALGCSRLWLGGEVEAGIPWSWMAGGRFPALPVVTKAGGFGEEDSLYHALKFMAK